MRGLFDKVSKLFGGGGGETSGADPASVALLQKLTSITAKGRGRLGELLALEARIDGDVAPDLARVGSYIRDLTLAGEPIEAHRINDYLRVHAHAFVGDIALDGEGWHLAGRFKDSGQDYRFATAADLVWGGLVLTGRPSKHIAVLYEIQRRGK